MKNRDSYRKPSKRRLRFILTPLIIIALIAAGVWVAIKLTSNSTEQTKTKDEEFLTTIASDFYENYFYPQLTDSLDDPKNALETYSDGLKLRLEVFKRYSTDKSEELLKQYDESGIVDRYDEEESQVVITPKPDYANTDYELRFELREKSQDEQ